MTRFRVTGLAVLLAAGVAVLAGSGIHPTAAPGIRFRAIDGNQLALADLRGRPVLVQFWATTCSICLEEQPRLVELYRQLHPRGLELVAVSMFYDRPDFVLRMARERQLPFPVALDVDGSVGRAFGGVEATPSTFLIDPLGRIVFQSIGRLDFSTLRDRIQQMLEHS